MGEMTGIGEWVLEEVSGVVVFVVLGIEPLASAPIPRHPLLLEPVSFGSDDLRVVVTRAAKTFPYVLVHRSMDA